MRAKEILKLLLLCVTMSACAEEKISQEKITLGAGCFWCIEAAYNRVEGVISSKSGYMGGKVENPTYKMICSGTTGHAEVVEVVFNPKKTSLKKILDLFWKLHDPTTLNRQGADRGTQYRSAIFYENEEQKKIVESSLLEAQKSFENKIVTEITKSSKFYAAEDYHQNYYTKNKSKNPYCRIVISPKLLKLGFENKEKTAE